MLRVNACALVLLAFTPPAQGQNTPATRPPPPCAASEHRQFDFWVGRWDVYATGTDTMVARSLIERLYGGCAIRENWMPLKGAGGGSLNNYVVEAKGWHQTWVDSSNARVDFTGGLIDGKMVLTGVWKGLNGPGTSGTIRMTYSHEADGAVRQLGEVTNDAGKSWQPSFDFTYRPAQSAAQ